MKSNAKGVQDVIKPTCRLEASEQNTYSLVGLVTTVLEEHAPQLTREFVNKAVKLSSYDEVLVLSQDYVHFHDGESNEPAID